MNASEFDLMIEKPSVDLSDTPQWIPTLDDYTAAFRQLHEEERVLETIHDLEQAEREQAVARTNLEYQARVRAEIRAKAQQDEANQLARESAEAYHRQLRQQRDAEEAAAAEYALQQRVAQEQYNAVENAGNSVIAPDGNVYVAGQFVGRRIDR